MTYDGGGTANGSIMMTVTMLGVDRVFTRADLDAMPDDGRRHELIDGAIVVTTAWELSDGAYVEVAEVGPDETWAASAPFGVSVRPVDLLR